jgi:hypothetical protein
MWVNKPSQGLIVCPATPEAGTARGYLAFRRAAQFAVGHSA